MIPSSKEKNAPQNRGKIFAKHSTNKGFVSIT